METLKLFLAKIYFLIFVLGLQEGQRGRRKSLDKFSSTELQLGGLLHIIHLLQQEMASF